MALTAVQLADLMPDMSQLESDEPEMESSLHYAQLALLVACLEWLWGDRQDFFIGANLTIYFSHQQLKNRDFRGPDFFLVQQTERKPRKSWVVWEENGQYPDIIIELLSDSTASTDRALKKVLYQDRFHTPEYFWFSPETLEFQGFRIVGRQYEEIQPNAQGWRWSETLNLFLGIYNQQLRYFDPEGQLIPTPIELATQTQAQAVQAQAIAAQAQAEAEAAQAIAAQAQAAQVQTQAQVEQLAAQLRTLGIEPEKFQ
jgi:Uma2 family endonuclease